MSVCCNEWQVLKNIPLTGSLGRNQVLCVFLNKISIHGSHVPNPIQTWHTARIPYGVNKLLTEFRETVLEERKEIASVKSLRPQAQRQTETLQNRSYKYIQISSKGLENHSWRDLLEVLEVWRRRMLLECSNLEGFSSELPVTKKIVDLSSISVELSALQSAKVHTLS